MQRVGRITSVFRIATALASAIGGSEIEAGQRQVPEDVNRPHAESCRCSGGHGHRLLQPPSPFDCGLVGTPVAPERHTQAQRAFALVAGDGPLNGDAQIRLFGIQPLRPGATLRTDARSG